MRAWTGRGGGGRRWALIVILVGCGDAADPAGDPPDADPPAVDPSDDTLPAVVEPLTPRALFVRASLDLRGTRPTADELRALDADPAQLEPMLDALAAGDGLGNAVALQHLEAWQTLAEDTFADLRFFVDDVGRDELLDGIGWEPLRILMHIVDEDLPLGELVTGDWTMTNEHLATIWPVTYPAGASGWVRSQYTDGRPAAGVLSTNGLWWQYGSMLNNLNRGRANTFSRIFLCYDFLDTEIDFSADAPLGSEAALGEAIRTDPACKGCHDALDPLASHFFGFWWYSGRKKLPTEIPYYHPERERVWADLGGLPPSFAGEPTDGLADLGRRTASDPRFATCFAQRSVESMLRRTVTAELKPQVDHVADVFVASGLNVRALYRAIVDLPAYRERAGADGLKLVSPPVLGSQIGALTGYAWRRGPRELMTAPEEGFMALAGGVEGVYRSVPLREPSATFALVHKRLAESAAGAVVARDLDDPANARLLRRVSFSTNPESDEALMRQQLQDLYLEVLSQDVALDDPRVDEDLQLWRDLRDLGFEPFVCWQGVLSAMLRDPALVVY